MSFIPYWLVTNWQIKLFIAGAIIFYTCGVFAYGYMKGGYACKLGQVKEQLNAERNKSQALRAADDCLLFGGVWLQDSGKCSMSVR